MNTDLAQINNIEITDLYKNRVLTIYPKAYLIEDMDCDGDAYDNSFAKDNRFAIITSKILPDFDTSTHYQTTYFKILSVHSTLKIEWISGWEKTIDDAWEAAWNSISSNMIRALQL